MPRNLKIALGILSVAVVVGLISLRGLQQRMRGLAETQSADQKARLEVLAPPTSTPSDARGSAKLYWAAGEDRVAATIVELPLSADPVERAKQVLQALIADAPSPEQRTIPADATLLAFYLLPDGTAIADFSDQLSSQTPSGIESEQVVLDSISRTLENNVPTVRRLKILIDGQEVDTLGGHLDLTGFFDLNPPDAQPAASSAASQTSEPPVSPSSSTRPAAEKVSTPAAATPKPSR
jgi:spore germination protein GerM